MSGYINLTTNIARSNVSRLSFPYKLTFVVTYWCNYKCKTCNIWKRKPTDELTLEEIDRFFARSNHFNWIDFTGGEPWLRKDFPDIVLSALQHCRNLVLVHFPTNGYQTEQILSGVKKILAHKPKKLIITVSVDGDEVVNDEVRGKKGGWKRQIETYKRLHQLLGSNVVMGMTLSQFNAGGYDQAYQAAKSECPWLQPSDFHINIMHESAHYYGNSKNHDDRGSEKLLLKAVRDYRIKRSKSFGVVNYLENRYLKNAEKYLETSITPVRCSALKSSCFVDSWGNVYPCGMYDAKIANLREYDYKLGEIWNLPQSRKLQDEIWNYDCPQCWTPCEAYQSLLGNLVGLNRTPKRIQYSKHGLPAVDQE